MKKRCAMLFFLIILIILGVIACSAQNDIPPVEKSAELEAINTNIVGSTASEVTDEPADIRSEEQTLKTVESEFDLEVHFIDVGQADATLLISSGHYMLIDGGNLDDSSLIYSYLNKLDISYLDYMIGTHAHEDHMGGLSGALQKSDVGTVYIPRTESNAKFYQTFMRKLSEKGINPLNPISGTSLDFGNCKVQLFCPKYENSDNLNNTSIITKVTCGDISFVFTGDAEREEEQDILSQGFDFTATVLKAGHHGSDTSSSYPFLRAVMPEYVVISCGKNNQYGHPNENALSRFRDVGAKTYRTDLQGDVIFRSDGHQVTVETQKNINADTNSTIAQGSYNSQTAQATNNEAQYIGNKNSNKFHRPTCHSLPAEKNRLYFSSRDEAVEHGFLPCGNCNP